MPRYNNGKEVRPGDIIQGVDADGDVFNGLVTEITSQGMESNIEFLRIPKEECESQRSVDCVLLEDGPVPTSIRERIIAALPLKPAPQPPRPQAQKPATAPKPQAVKPVQTAPAPAAAAPITPAAPAPAPVANETEQ